MAAYDFEHLIVDIPDYPEPGVVFKDITPLLADAQGFAAVVDSIAEHFAGAGVPARKPGKLPRETASESYALEYGTDALEIHLDAISSDDVVLLVDDLVATGGTAVAQARLVERFGAKLAGMGFLMELAFLEPRKAIAQATDVEVFSLVQVK